MSIVALVIAPHIRVDSSVEKHGGDYSFSEERMGVVFEGDEGGESSDEITFTR